MAGILSTILGAAEVAAGIALEFVPGGQYLGFTLIAAGAGQLISGISQLVQGDPVNGLATTTRNPIAPWKVCYGTVRTGGTLVYLHNWGNNNQILDMVVVLASHPCEAITEVLFDQQRVQIDTSAIPTSAKAGYSIPTPVAGSGTSFTPVQQTVNISTIVRDAHGVVTVTLPANIPYLTAGDQIEITDVTGDLTLNGSFQVAEIISQVFGGPGSIVFTYLSGGSPASVSSAGHCKTKWPDYGRTVYVEYLTGHQTLGETFVGMTAGTPWLGTGKLCTPASPQNAGGTPQVNPWTNYCSLVGKTAVFIRLSYDPDSSTGVSKYFPSGMPQISFVLKGKNDIYDARLGAFGDPGTTGYTDNSALCIADVLSNQTWGFKAAYGTEMPSAELIDAANTCDETVALVIGGSEKRYTCNGQFDVSQRRGETLQNMLTSCSGRITYQGGQFVIHPGRWVAGTAITQTVASTVGQGKTVYIANGGTIPSGWETPAFDDSAWSVPVADTGYFPGTAFAGSHWITAVPTPTTHPGDVMLYRMPFTLTSIPTSATVQAWSDDWTSAAYINGTRVLTGSPGIGPFGGLTATVSSSVFVLGTNVLAVESNNFSPVYMSCDFLLTITGYADPSDINLIPMASGPFKWRPTPSVRDWFNGCKGTFISPQNKWQSTDFPAYAQNYEHGYGLLPGDDILLDADGGERRWLELNLPFTISAGTAQRIAKIELLKRRNGGTGTFSLNMNGYQFAPLDVIGVNLPFLSWSGKVLEIEATRLKLDEANGAITLGTDIDVQETDSSIYQWSTEEELSPQGYVQSNYPRGFVVPTSSWPWSPGYAAPLAGDALYNYTSPATQASFGIQPTYGVDAQGHSNITLQVKGTPPINALDFNIAAPQFFATASSTGGSLQPGDYVVGVSAFDSGLASHSNTDYQSLAIVDVGGSGSGSIAITINPGSGDDGFEIYIGQWNSTGVYVFHFNQTIAPGVTSATITSIDLSKHGGPDPIFRSFGIVPSLMVHGGPWAAQIYSLTSTTITVGAVGMTTDQWAGYTLSLLGKVTPNVEIPILNMSVTGNTASSGGLFTLTIGANSAGVSLPNLTTLLSVGDVVMMRHNATFNASSFTDPNIANGFYPTGATGVEAGHLAVVLTGADAGDVQTVASVTTDAFGNYTVFNLAGSWAVTPATGDLVIICAGNQPEWKTAPIYSKSAAIGGIIVAQPNVDNLAGQPWLFRVRTENAEGISGPDSLAPYRELYIFGGQGSRTITSNTTQSLTDGMLLCDTTAGNITVQLLSLTSVPNMRLIVKKVSADANTVTILPFSGETIDSLSSFTLLLIGDLLEIKANG